MQRGIIYALSNDLGQLYIGSTTEPANVRFSKHKNAYKRFRNGLPVSMCSAFTVFGGCQPNEVPTMNILEELDVNTRAELLRREGHYIRENAAICVNKLVAGRTKLEHYRENAEQVKQKSREYYNRNKEMIKQRRRYIRLLALGLI